MSYDLAVFGPRDVSSDELRGLVGDGSAGLVVADEPGLGATVLRGARGRYSFTVDGPDDVEDGDVPDEVSNVLLEARIRYLILVEGSAPVEIPHAVRFARRLALAIDGAVLDLQSDVVWSRARSRVVRQPARQTRVQVVSMRWSCLRADLGDDPSRVVLAAAHRYLPEAMPRRYGDVEPLRRRLEETGETGFAAARAATDLFGLFFTGSAPCLGGHLGAAVEPFRPTRFWSASLTFLAAPLHVRGWRDPARRLFVAIAENLPAFHASAEVTGGHLWTGRSTLTDGHTDEGLTTLRHHDGWIGLSPLPAWWTWLGAPYRDVNERLPDSVCRATGAGVMIELAETPTTADGLPPLTTWLPPSLCASFAPNPEGVRPAPLVRAREIPAPLQHDEH